ncbi:hypothetical protein HN446_01490 [bacterium]|jgi:hypothetical protein|nr:hypothetical protein [bacterium]
MKRFFKVALLSSLFCVCGACAESVFPAILADSTAMFSSGESRWKLMYDNSSVEKQAVILLYLKLSIPVYYAISQKNDISYLNSVDYSRSRDCLRYEHEEGAFIKEIEASLNSMVDVRVVLLFIIGYYHKFAGYDKTVALYDEINHLYKSLYPAEEPSKLWEYTKAAFFTVLSVGVGVAGTLVTRKVILGKFWRP